MTKKDKTFSILDHSEYKGGIDKKYVPEGFDSVEDYLQDVRETFDLDISADAANRSAALEDKKFTAGEQWDPIVLDQRKGLPSLTINSIPQFTAQVVGDWRVNRPGIKVIPAEDGDAEIAEIFSDLIRAIEVESRAERVYDNAFESCLQCGDGAFRVAVEYAHGEVFDQKIFLRPIDDALSVVWDRMSVDPTGRDARHCFVSDTISKKEFERKWPGKDSSSLDTKAQKSCRVGGWIESDGYRVTEHWRMISRTHLLGLFDDGTVHEITSDNVEELMMAHGELRRTRESSCLYAQMHLVTGFAILDGPYEYRLSRVPILRMSGRVINLEGYRFRYGMVRFMKDSVRYRNFVRSVAAEQLGYAPKAQWLATETAVEGREDDFRRAHLTRDPLLMVNEGTVVGKDIQRIEPPAAQLALLNEAQIAAQDFKDVTGIHDASLGLRSNEISGRAIKARQQEGDIANQTYHDNGNAAILEAGDIITQLIGQIYDATRVIRVVGQDDEARLIKVNNPEDKFSPDLTLGSYDVIPTTGPSYMTRRQEQAEAMLTAVNAYPALMQIAGDLIVKAQDWPGADDLSERLARAIPPNLLTPEEQKKNGVQPQNVITPEMMQEVQKMQETLQKTMEENKALKLDLQNKVRELEIKEYDSVTQRIRALSDNMVDGTQLEQNAIAELLQHSRELEKMKVSKEASASKPDQTANAAPSE